MYPKNARKRAVKSIHNLQQAVLSDTPTPLPCGIYGISNEWFLSILITSSFSKHNSQRHQTLTNHLRIPMIVLHQLQNRNPYHGRYSMKSSYNLYQRYVPSKPTKIFNPTTIHLRSSMRCDDPTPNSGGTPSAMRSTLLSCEKPGHSYVYRLDNAHCP